MDHSPVKSERPCSVATVAKTISHPGANLKGDAGGNVERRGTDPCADRAMRFRRSPLSCRTSKGGSHAPPHSVGMRTGWPQFFTPVNRPANHTKHTNKAQIKSSPPDSLFVSMGVIRGQPGFQPLSPPPIRCYCAARSLPGKRIAAHLPFGVLTGQLHGLSEITWQTLPAGPFP